MIERLWSLGETRLRIKSESEESIKLAVNAVRRARQDLKDIISRNADFRYSLSPISLDLDGSSRVVGLMQRASEIAEVGPFAAVAGSISQVATEAGLGDFSENMLVDNGGDISIMGYENFRVGIYAGDSVISGKLVFSIATEDLPLGICTSSGSVGHSISLGDADAAVALSDEASISDAVATSLANEVNEEDIEASIKRGLDKCDDIPEVRGCMIIKGGRIGMVGKLPEIFKLGDGDKTQPMDLKLPLASVLE